MWPPLKAIQFFYDGVGNLVKTVYPNGNETYYAYTADNLLSGVKVVNTYAYDPWGKVLSANEQVANPYRYAGYRYDAGTGLYCLYKRYYEPGACRFLTRDLYPGNLYNSKSLNCYAYVGDNPINYVDPSGLRGIEVGVNLGIVEFGFKLGAEGMFLYGGFGQGKTFLPKPLDALTFNATSSKEYSPGLNWGLYVFGKKLPCERARDAEKLGTNQLSISANADYSFGPFYGITLFRLRSGRWIGRNGN